MNREQAIEAGARGLYFAQRLATHLNGDRASIEARWDGVAHTATADDYRADAAAVLDAIGWAETTTEWGVRHSQGFIHEDVGRPYTEDLARAKYADFVRRDATSRWETRGKTRLMRREVTPWSIVPVEES